MKVFKFGGASIQHANAIKQLIHMITHYQEAPLIVVVSAMGKTTQSLEIAFQNKITNQPYGENIKELIHYHQVIIKDLFGNTYPKIVIMLKSFQEQLEQALKFDANTKDLDKHYSHLVSWGEMVSSKIIHCYLQAYTKNCVWLDARKFIKTQQGFINASINWKETKHLVKEIFFPILTNYPLILTQGFIGSNQTGETTTLGKEGSDFTGAIISTILKAQSLTIWKDVPGVMNADPKLFPNAIQFDQLSYQEMAKMAFYGAKVVHPQTIKPLAKHDIPLYVKPFSDWHKPGTLINNGQPRQNLPIYIIKSDQRLIQLRLKDFAFLDEKHVCYVLKRLDALAMKIHMLEKSAYTLTLCLDNNFIKIAKLLGGLNKKFSLQQDTPVSLLTVIGQAHRRPRKYLQNKAIVLVHQSQDFYQAAFTTKPDEQ